MILTCFRLLLFIFSIICSLKSSFPDDIDIYYVAPYLNIEFMNMTLGMVLPDQTLFSEYASGGIIAAICQAEKFNQKQYAPINFKGLINIAVQKYDSYDSLGQYASMQQFMDSLYNKTTKAALSSRGITNLAGIIGSGESGQNRVNSEVTSGVSIPYISPGTITQVNPSSEFVVASLIENRTYFSIRDTIDYNSFSVLIDLMKYYNWNLGANIYQDTTFGLSSQQVVQKYKAENYSPIFPCDAILSTDTILDPYFYEQFCNCMSDVNSLTLLSIWTVPILAYKFIIKFKSLCKAADKFIFFVMSESEPLPPDLFYDEENFKSVFIVRPFGELNFKSFVAECLEMASPQAAQTINQILDRMLKNYYNCYRFDEDTKKLQVCSGDIFKRPVECICNNFEFDPLTNPYGAQNFFFADAVSMFVQVISILQANCSAVNEMLQSRTNKIVRNIDLCNIKNITPAILTGILALTNFTGYTGKIFFDNPNGNFRNIKPFYLYNVHTTIRDAKLVGVFSTEGYTINQSLVLLPNGNNTISMLVPSNPNLEDGVIAVFFGLSILLLIMIIPVAYFLYHYRHHLLIRRNTPKISFLMLFGLTLMTISALIYCLGVYDWNCDMFFFLFYVGQGILIGGMISKNYRIYKIFKNTSATPVIIRDSRLFLIIGLITFYFCLLFLFAMLTGLGAYVYTSSSNSLYLYVECSFESKFWTMFMQILVQCSSIFLRLIALIIALLTRKVSRSYSESYQILIVLGIYVCIDITTVPLYFTLESGTDSAILRAVVKFIHIFVTISAALIFLFYYRMLMVYWYDSARRSSSRIQSNLSAF